METGKNYNKVTIKFLLLEEYIKRIEEFINFLEICHLTIAMIFKKFNEDWNKLGYNFYYYNIIQIFKYVTWFLKKFNGDWNK